jgi:alpha-beta hydrolase superfamily lysophospholipase
MVLNAPGFKPALSFLPGFLSDFGIWSGATLGKALPNFPVVPMGNRMLFSQIGKLIIHDPAVKQRAMDDPHFTHSAVSAAFVTGLHAMSKNIQANLDKVKTPFIIINGTRDTLVPYQSGDLLMAKAGATDKTRKLYKGMSHCTLHDHDKEKVWADILTWMEARLPAPVAAMSPADSTVVKAGTVEEIEPAL